MIFTVPITEPDEICLDCVEQWDYFFEIVFPKFTNMEPSVRIRVVVYHSHCGRMCLMWRTRFFWGCCQELKDFRAHFFQAFLTVVIRCIF